MSLQVYNTLTHNKEPFVPLVEGEVKMYVCGPTVYGFLHVGNFRGPIFFNLVRNWLEKNGLNVTYAYNYTDVDDKIIAKAIAENVSPEEIAERYIAEFQVDYKSLKLRPHSMTPKVTDSMDAIVAMVNTLITNGKAYVAGDGEVLYSVRSFDGYGKLSNKNLDDLQAGARVEVDAKKRDPMDFVLWKPAKPGEPKWPSPWSEGRPGWHIECSAMIHSLLGSSIDIHGGGSDLIFPHHENEIAQSEGAGDTPFVKYWMHNNMLTFGDKKMSKSAGNIMRAREFIEKYNGEILKYMMLSVHYRSLSDFSEQAVNFAIAGLAKFYSALNLAEKTLAAGEGIDSTLFPQKGFATALGAARVAATAALNDDFNTPELFAAMFTLIRSFNSLVRLGAKPTPEILSVASHFREFILSQGQLLSLFEETPAEFLTVLDDMLLTQKGLERSAIDALVANRIEARTAKDFKRSDELRDELVAMGISLQDTPAGTFWEVAK